MVSLLQQYTSERAGDSKITFNGGFFELVGTFESMKLGK